MSALPEPKVSPEEYLAAERQSDTKHEYVNGEVYAMAGASFAHNQVVANVVRDLGTRLQRGPCQILPSDLRLQVEETGLYTRPDAMVLCEPPRLADSGNDTLLNPRIVIEVLSESTEANDRGWKWAHYRQLESLAEYLMIAQDRPHVEQYVRRPDGSWLFRENGGLDATMPLPSLGCELALSEVYHLVTFPPEA